MKTRRVRRTPFAGALAVALAIGATAVGQAPDSGVVITRLGGPNAFMNPAPKSVADFQKKIQKRKADVEAALELSGWGGNPADLFAAIEAGNMTETTIPVGTKLEWMALRKGKKVAVLRDGTWGGKAPAPAWEIRLTSNDADYVFLVPKPCGNIAMLSKTPIPVPVCRIQVMPTKDCITRTITVDATGSNVSAGSLTKVWVEVKGPDGKSESLGTPSSAGTWKWTKSFRNPGTYAFSAVAESDRGKKSVGSCDAKVEITPCPPSCAIAVSVNQKGDGIALDPNEMYVFEDATVDASGSKAQVGTLKVVHVKVADAKGSEVTAMDLETPFQGKLTLRDSGGYALAAVAEDDLGQKSENTCAADMTVIRRTGLIIDAFGGKERRTRSEEFGGRCAPLVGARLGPSYLINRNWELAALVGGFVNTRDDENSGFLADAEINYLRQAGFFGFGVGMWDFTSDDWRTGSVYLHGGLNLTRGHRPPAFFVEGRLFFDEMDNIEDNYAIYGGLRFPLFN